MTNARTIERSLEHNPNTTAIDLNTVGTLSLCSEKSAQYINKLKIPLINQLRMRKIKNLSSNIIMLIVDYE